MADRQIVVYRGGRRPTMTSNTKVLRLKQGVTHIPEKMFQKLDLEELEFDNNRELTEFGSKCFYQCNKLTGIHWSYAHALTTIHESAFRETAIAVVTSLPESLVNIEESAFRSCAKLKEFQSPPHLKRLGECILQGCSQLKKVDLNESLEEIGNFAFEGTGSLRSIDIPRCQRIGNNCFSGSGLTQVNLRGMTPEFSMGRSVFQACVHLTHVHLPVLLRTIEANTFHGCHRLRLVEFPLDTLLIDDAAFAKTGIGSVRLPTCLQAVGEEAFFLSSLREFAFPAAMKTIGVKAFHDCSELASVRFDSSSPKLEAIGSKAFYDTPRLTSAAIPADKLRSVGNAAFDHESIRNIEFVYNAGASGPRSSRIKIITNEVITGQEHPPTVKSKLTYIKLENMLPNATPRKTSPQLVLKILYGVRNILGLTPENETSGGPTRIHQELVNNMHYEFLTSMAGTIFK